MTGALERDFMKRSYYYILPLAGTCFCLWYIFRASADVVYSDYIRLVNSYLPDVWNPSKFFVPDILTRIPVNFLARLINVGLFGFNTMFDRVLGAFSLGLSGLVLGRYCRVRRVGLLWFILVMGMLFSLDKWEMLINGSGWAHFLAFAGFYYHYLVLDRVWGGREKCGDRIMLAILPFAITVLIAGPYCAIYNVTLMLAWGFIALTDYRKTKWISGACLLYALCSLAALLLYMWSNAYAVEDYAGAVSVSLSAQLMDTPGFFIRFLLISFSSMVVGIEEAGDLFGANFTPMAVLGMLVICAYLLALFLNFRYRLYEKTVFPLILLVAGGLNHVLILLSRWMFLDDRYGASSRYALQYQAGIFGILLTFALCFGLLARKKRRLFGGVALALSLMFLVGNGYTTYREWEKAPFRKEIFETRKQIALDFESKTDDELRENFEYRKTQPESGVKVRNALTILKENGWNVFRDPAGGRE